MSAPTTTTQQSPFEALPRTIATSYVLPYVTSNDWLNFRVASRSCYELVHDTRDVSLSTLNSINQTHATSNTSGDGENDESESLWRLALVRDYGFEGTEDENILHQSIHSPANSRDDAFLSTDNIFTAPNSFISWKHWRKIDISFHHRTRCVFVLPDLLIFVSPTSYHESCTVCFLSNIWQTSRKPHSSKVGLYHHWVLH